MTEKLISTRGSVRVERKPIAIAKDGDSGEKLSYSPKSSKGIKVQAYGIAKDGKHIFHYTIFLYCSSDTKSGFPQQQLTNLRPF